jgi:DNA-binding XRE family transcriptional regulator
MVRSQSRGALANEPSGSLLGAAQSLSDRGFLFDRAGGSAMATVSKKRKAPSQVLVLDHAKLAAQVRGARAVLNWSQTELAVCAGLTQRSIHRLEQGATDMRRSTALLVQHALRDAGVQFEQLPDSGFKIVISGPTLKKISLAGRKK